MKRLLVGCVLALVAALASAVLLANPASADPSQYVISPLGTLGGSWSYAYAINEQGQVVGESETADGDDHAVLWDKGTAIDLGGILASDVNDRGQVVGQAEADDGNSHAFLWENGVMKDLGTLGDESQANGINDRGQVVGLSSTDDGEYHAVLWENGRIVDLGTLGGDYGEARAINDAGEVVGISTTADGDAHTFLWKNGVMTDLGLFVLPYAMNNRGVIAGDTDPEGAVVFDHGILTALGTLGGKYGVALGINNLDQVVGNAQTKNGYAHAFVWENGLMTDLGTLDDDTVSEAHDINNRGQIVGQSSGETANAVIWQRTG
jgi:probable HAF family extracellular repeat protein